MTVMLPVVVSFGLSSRDWRVGETERLICCSPRGLAVVTGATSRAATGVADSAKAISEAAQTVAKRGKWGMLLGTGGVGYLVAINSVCGESIVDLGAVGHGYTSRAEGAGRGDKGCGGGGGGDGGEISRAV